MVSQSWENNVDHSIAPLDAPNKSLKIEEQGVSSCPKCC